MEGERVYDARLIVTGELVQLAAGEPDARPRLEAVFVRAGRIVMADGRPGNVEIMPEALSRAVDAGMFNKCAVFVDHAGWFDHPSLSRMVGVTRDARFDGQAVSGEIELYSTPLATETVKLIEEVIQQGRDGPDVGLSMVFYPIWEVGASNEIRKLTGIRKVESVDLVFQPAADGRVLQLLQAAQNEEGGIEMDPSEEIQTEIDVTTADATAWVAAISEAGAAAMINASGLPQVSRQRLLSQTYINPEECSLAIQAEQEYIASLQAANVVQLNGPAPRGQISGMVDGLDQVQAALDALIAGVRPADGVRPLTGIREAYHLLSGDYEMSGLFQPDRVSFANVNSSTMAGLVANALNKRLANEFQQYPQWWAPIVSVEDFSTLQAVKWITLGGVGELPTVAEGAAYTELTWDDKTESASFVKKGGYLGLTLEAIDKDDTGRIRAAPRALAQAAWLTLGKAISAIFTASSGVGPTMSDSLALFEAGTHANLGSTALSITTYNAARLAMRKQTELNSGERLGALTAPKFLLVPPDLEITALQVLASEHDYLYALSNGQAAPVNVHAEGNDFQARMNAARSRVIVVDLWTDTNDWAAVADPRMYPTIGLGFRYGRMPEIFSVASPTAGLMFSNDTMPIKVRFFFATGPIDYKGLYKANVT